VNLGSSVDTNGLLSVGDEIIRVNNVDVTRMLLDDVVLVMKFVKRMILTVKVLTAFGFSSDLTLHKSRLSRELPEPPPSLSSIPEEDGRNSGWSPDIPKAINGGNVEFKMFRFRTSKQCSLSESTDKCTNFGETFMNNLGTVAEVGDLDNGTRNPVVINPYEEVNFDAKPVKSDLECGNTNSYEEVSFNAKDPVTPVGVYGGESESISPYARVSLRTGGSSEGNRIEVEVHPQRDEVSIKDGQKTSIVCEDEISPYARVSLRTEGVDKMAKMHSQQKVGHLEGQSAPSVPGEEISPYARVLRSEGGKPRVTVDAPPGDSDAKNPYEAVESGNLMKMDGLLALFRTKQIPSSSPAVKRRSDIMDDIVVSPDHVYAQINKRRRYSSSGDEEELVQEGEGEQDTRRNSIPPPAPTSPLPHDDSMSMLPDIILAAAESHERDDVNASAEIESSPLLISHSQNHGLGTPDLSDAESVEKRDTNNDEVLLLLGEEGPAPPLPPPYVPGDGPPDTSDEEDESAQAVSNSGVELSVIRTEMETVTMSPLRVSTPKGQARKEVDCSYTAYTEKEEEEEESSDWSVSDLERSDKSDTPEELLDGKPSSSSRLQKNISQDSFFGLPPPPPPPSKIPEEERSSEWSSLPDVGSSLNESGPEHLPDEEPSNLSKTQLHMSQDSLPSSSHENSEEGEPSSSSRAEGSQGLFPGLPLTSLQAPESGPASTQRNTAQDSSKVSSLRYQNMSQDSFSDLPPPPPPPTDPPEDEDVSGMSSLSDQEDQVIFTLLETTSSKDMRTPSNDLLSGMISLRVHGLDITRKRSKEFWSEHDVQKVIFVAAVDGKVKVTVNIPFNEGDVSADITDCDEYQFLVFNNERITFSVNPMCLPTVSQLATLSDAFPGCMEGVRRVYIDLEAYGQLKLSLEYHPIKSVIRRMGGGGYSNPTFSDLVSLNPSDSSCPLVLEQCMEVIERHGLNTPHLYERCTPVQYKHRALEACLNNSNSQSLKNVVVRCSVHAFTGLVLDLFQDLPEPFFTNDISSTLTQSASVDGTIGLLENFLLCLPDEVSTNMNILLKHFHRLLKHREKNGVTVKSIARLFGPLLLIPSLHPDLNTNMAALDYADDYDSQARVIELLLSKAGRDEF
jgi:hypothetical protein